MGSKRLILIVLSAHLALLGIGLLSPSSSKTREKKSISVRTINEAPKKLVAHQAASIKKEKSVTQKKVTPVVKKTAPPAPPKKAPVVKSIPKNSTVSEKKPKIATPEKKNKEPLISDELAHELQETLAALEKAPQHPTEKLLHPSPVQTKQELLIDKIIPETHNSFASLEETLVQTLQASLRLPEYGEVTMQITLRRDGSVTKCVVLKALSQKNREYLEKRVPEVTFLQLETPNESETFTLTFCNL